MVSVWFVIAVITPPRQRASRWRLPVHSLWNSVIFLYKKAGHTIALKCPDDFSIYSYPGLFYQIISNLIMNSITHGFEGRKNGQIEIDIWWENNWAAICYKDNGKGMDTEVLEQIYNPFFTTKRSHGSTGLGMHILYNLVSQSLKGEIACTSSPGQGVVFLFRIPIGEKPSNDKIPETIGTKKSKTID